MRLLLGFLTLLFCAAALPAQPAVLVDDVQADDTGRQWAREFARELQARGASVFVASQLANAPAPAPPIASGAATELESLGMPFLPGQPDPGQILDSVDPALAVIVLPGRGDPEFRLGAQAAVSPRPVAEAVLGIAEQLDADVRRDLLFSRLGIGSDIGLRPYLEEGVSAFALNPGGPSAMMDAGGLASLVEEIPSVSYSTRATLPEQNYLLVRVPGRTLVLGETAVATLLWAAGLILTSGAAILRSASRRYRRSLRQNRGVVLRSLVAAWAAFAVAGLLVAGLFRLFRWPGGYLEANIGAFLGRVAVALAIGGVLAVLPRARLRRTNSSAYSAGAIAISVLSTATAVFVDPALALLMIASLFCIVGTTLVRPPWLKLFLVILSAIAVGAFGLVALTLAGPAALAELLTGPLIGAALLGVLALPVLLSLGRLRLILPFTRHVHRRRRLVRSLVTLALSPIAAAFLVLPAVANPVREVTVTVVVRRLGDDSSARIWVDAPRPADLSDLRALFPPLPESGAVSESSWRLQRYPSGPELSLLATDAGPQRRRVQLTPGAGAGLGESPLRLLLPDSSLLLSAANPVVRRPGGGQVDFPAGMGGGEGLVLAGPAGGTARFLHVSGPISYRTSNLRVLQTTVFALQVPLP